MQLKHTYRFTFVAVLLIFSLVESGNAYNALDKNDQLEADRACKLMTSRLAHDVSFFGELKYKVSKLDDAREVSLQLMRSSTGNVEQSRAVSLLSDAVKAREEVFSSIEAKREIKDRSDFEKRKDWGRVASFSDFLAIRSIMARRYKDFPDDLARDYELQDTHLAKSSVGLVKGQKFAKQLGYEECRIYFGIN